jgi:hypothetical protein
MSFPELLEAVRKLPRSEKIRLMHELVDDVTRSPEEAAAASLGIAPGTTFDVWFQPNGAAGAAVLQTLLAQAKAC